MDSTKEREKRAILIIDSDRSGAERLKSLLNKNAYRVYTAGTLKEAQMLAEEKSVIVALLVLGRPGLDPGRIIKGMKRGKDDVQIPVIVILETFVEDLAASALRAGAVDFLNCPVDSQELTKRIGVHTRMENITLPDPEPVSISKRLLVRLLPRLFRDLYSRSGESEFLGRRYKKVARLGTGSFDVIEVKNKRILILEFIIGKTLYEVIERELDEKEVESVVIQIVDVVAHAHDIGIIHRDIKPGNMMVKPDGAIKLLDFGAAKELKEKEMSNTVTGSRPFMSPEQIMGKSQRGSDVWALGVVMYVLYTGMFPFYHDVEKVLMDMILEVPPSPPSKLNEELAPEIERIILKCLEKKPENRYPDARALKEDITVSFPGYGENILPLY
jgi:serine/threonine protein kinase